MSQDKAAIGLLTVEQHSNSSGGSLRESSGSDDENDIEIGLSIDPQENMSQKVTRIRFEDHLLTNCDAPLNPTLFATEEYSSDESPMTEIEKKSSPKLLLNTSNEKIDLPCLRESTTLESLKKQISEEHEGKPPPGRIRCYYKDEDSDFLKIETDADLQEARNAAIDNSESNIELAISIMQSSNLDASVMSYAGNGKTNNFLSALELAESQEVSMGKLSKNTSWIPKSIDSDLGHLVRFFGTGFC